MDAGFLRGLERRVFSLERRLSAALRSLRFTDLEDVPPFAEITAPDTDESTVWAVDWDTFDSPRWMPVNIGAAGGTGAYASIRVDDEEGTGTTLRWSLASEPGLSIAPVATGGTRGAAVTAAGVYQVNAWAWSNGTATRVLVYGPQIDVDSEPCLGQSAADDGVTAAAASTLMALPAGGHVAVTVTHDGTEAGWTLTMHLVHEAEVAEGICGG